MKLKNCIRLFCLKKTKIGCIGLGKIGLAMANNFAQNNCLVKCYDNSLPALERATNVFDGQIVNNVLEIVDQVDIIITILPNDLILKSVTNLLVKNIRPQQIHISCSTVSPTTSRELAKLHEKNNSFFVSAPVFSRPDGMAKCQATIPISGNKNAVERILPILQKTSKNMFLFGSDPGAANVVKLCGNYLIGCSIQSMSESLQLAESNGLNRKQVMEMLNSTIFDCLIYKGYGKRISDRDHYPYTDAHFSLELGKKDIKLVLETAFSNGVPLPFGCSLYNRFIASISKGRGGLDWSAISLLQSEDAGKNINKF